MSLRSYFNYFVPLNRKCPKVFMIICADRSVIEGDMTVAADVEKVRDALSHCLCVILANHGENKWGGQGQHPNGQQYIYVGPSTKDRIVQEFLKSYDDEAKLLAERAADPLKELEYLLSRHDWYFVYSDDHSVWASGQANLNKIMAILPKVDLEKAKELWAKYAEKDCEFPDNLAVR